MGRTEDLRISVPNNLHRPAALKPLLYSNYDLPMNLSAPRKVGSTGCLPKQGFVSNV